MGTERLTITEDDARLIARVVLEEMQYRVKAPRGRPAACECGHCLNCRVRISMRERRALEMLEEVDQARKERAGKK